ncbi:MAG: hypothetical protein IPJ43_19180 [Saprospiraceae bacterium]|nr:hypothetical protein [Saprospiraceae bacterium]
MWNALTTVLIVACPCALLLSQTYLWTYFEFISKNKFSFITLSYLSTFKSNILYSIKLGQSQIGNSSVKYFGRKLKPQEMENIYSILSNSMHPASQNVLSYLNQRKLNL